MLDGLKVKTKRRFQSSTYISHLQISCGMPACSMRLLHHNSSHATLSLAWCDLCSAAGRVTTCISTVGSVHALVDPVTLQALLLGLLLSSSWRADLIETG